MVSIFPQYLYNGNTAMNRDRDELIIKLKQAESILKRQQAAIAELRSENNLLSSTILNKEMGKISEERRQLRKEIRECKANESRAYNELQTYKDEYTDKYDELIERLQDVKSKQTDIDDYIAFEGERLVSDEKKRLQEQYSSREQTLKNKYAEIEQAIVNKIAIKNKIILCILIYAVLITIIMIWR